MTAPVTDVFIPLAVTPAPAGSREDFRVLVAARPELARPLRELKPSEVNPFSGHAHAGRGEPRVTLQKEADRVTGIHIECSCGQIIDLKCAYEDGTG